MYSAYVRRDVEMLRCENQYGPLVIGQFSVVLQPGDSGQEGGVVLHLTLKHHTVTPLYDLVLRLLQDPCGLWEKRRNVSTGHLN